MDAERTGGAPPCSDRGFPNRHRTRSSDRFGPWQHVPQRSASSGPTAGSRDPSRKRSAPTPSPDRRRRAAVRAGPRLRADRPAAARERAARRSRHHLPRRARPGEDAHHPLAHRLLDEWMPIIAGSEINDDPYAPGLALRPRPRRRARRRHPDHVGPPRRPLRREAGHAGHVDRRPHRRGRPDQGRRGPLPLRRADAALRPRAAHQPRHLRHQRAARPRRAHPGRPAQRARGARHPGARLQDPPARSTSCSWPRPTPRTTPTAAASSPR